MPEMQRSLCSVPYNRQCALIQSAEMSSMCRPFAATLIYRQLGRDLSFLRRENVTAVTRSAAAGWRETFLSSR